MDDQQRLINGSGLTIDYLKGKTVSTNADGQKRVNESRNETIVNRFTMNDIALTNDHPFRSFLHLKRGGRYAQYGGLPVIIESDYHISAEEYQRRKNLAWPVLPGTFIPRDRQATPQVKPVSSPKKAAAPEWTEEEIGGGPAHRWEPRIRRLSKNCLTRSVKVLLQEIQPKELSNETDSP